MYFYVCFCSALLIASAHSEHLALPHTNNTKTNSSSIAKLDKSNKTNMIVVSEGGTQLPNITDLSLPKDNQLNSLITLDEESSKTKEKAVVPRKGVDMQVDEKNPLPYESKLKVKPLLESTTTKKSFAAVTNEHADIQVNTRLPNNKSIGLKLENTEAPVPIKKPTILSYEKLANMEKQIQSDSSKITAVPSTKTMDNSQIPSPNQDSIRKVYPSKATNSHPGMIMPIVITILVVPMFAVVLYFGLKRGKEAWKNRHYKRMDFLLDGMYND